MRAALRVLSQVGALAAMILVWNVLVSQEVLRASDIGSPSGVLDDLTAWWADGQLLEDLASTLRILSLGYLLGMALGVAIGVLMGVAPLVRAVLDPFVTFFNAMPRILVYPFLAVWLGFGDAPKVVLIVFTIVFLVAIVVAGSFADLDAELDVNLKVLGASRWQRSRHLYAPAVADRVLSTARLAMGYALPAALIAEYVGATQGVGFHIVVSQGRFDPDGILAGVLVVLVVAVAVSAGISVLERRVTRWRGP